MSRPTSTCLFLISISISLATALALSGACVSSETSDSASAMDELSGPWALASLAAGEVPVGLQPSPGLAIAPDGRISGFGAVNSFSAQLAVLGLDERRFELGLLISTRMAGSPEAMDLEQRFLAALDSAEAFRVDGSELTLTAGGKTVARFARAPVPLPREP